MALGAGRSPNLSVDKMCGIFIPKVVYFLLPWYLLAHRFTHCTRYKLMQSPLGFATLDKAAALGLATATPMTDLRQYINSNLGFSDLEI